MEEQMSSGGSSGPESRQPRIFRIPGPLEPVQLPWTWATKQLKEADNYWIATTRPGGRPHCRPVWGVWLDETLYFNTVSQAVRNLAINPAITVHLESGSRVVILEGEAELVSDPLLVQRLVHVFSQKYCGITEPNWISEPFHVVRPHLAFGWLADASGCDGGAYFQGTATCWRFRESEAGKEER
jgi:Pyridoxamine 5'-phosphate oxidase